MAKHVDELSELIAFEEKLIGELPVQMCREHIERVKFFYIERHGLEAAKRIHRAMAAKLQAKRSPK